MVGGFGVVLFLVLAGVGLALREGFLVALGGMGALTMGISWAWYRLSLEGLSYGRELPSMRVFLGEEIPFSVRVVNSKPLPLPRVRVDDDFPDGVELLDGTLKRSPKPNLFNLSHSAALAWYESIRWSYHIRCRRRGYFRFGPVEVQSGDLFGFFTAIDQDPRVNHLLVYPRVIPLPELGLPALRPFGDLKSRSWIFQDTARPAGVRDYQPGDPMKLVDWKATARTQALKVRDLESTVSHSLVIVLNLDTLGVGWRGFSTLHLERAVTVAASVAHEALAGGQMVGLITNGTSLLYARSMSVPPARNLQQHLLIFETLAMVGPYVSGSIEEALLSHRARLPFGATLVMVTGVFPESLTRVTEELKRASYATQVLYVGDEPPEAMVPPGVAFQDLSAYFRAQEASDEWEY